MSFQTSSSSPEKISDYQLKSDSLYSSVKTPPSIVDPSEVGSDVGWSNCGKRSRDFKFIVPEMKRKRNNSLEMIEQKSLGDTHCSHQVTKDSNGCDVSNESSKTSLVYLDAFTNHTFETPPATPCEMQCLPSLDTHEPEKCPLGDLRGKIVTVPGTNGSEARKVVYAQCDCFESESNSDMDGFVPILCQ